MFASRLSHPFGYTDVPTGGTSLVVAHRPSYLPLYYRPRATEAVTGLGHNLYLCSDHA
jgi:hypothetical protein